MSHPLVLFCLLSIFWARIVRTQKTFATCAEDYKWAFNSKGESPCEVATELMAICWGTSFTTWPLSANATSYWGPWKGIDPPCFCSTVTWSLYSACGTCQNGTAIPWSWWAYNCSTVTVGSFPLTWVNTSQEVVIPHWAQLKVGDDSRWNETAAKEDAQNPPHSHRTPVGAIVGGIIGGLVALAIVMAVFVKVRGLRRDTPTSPSKPGTITAQPIGTSSLARDQPAEGQKFYNPYDPSTFPPPLSYDRPNAVHSSPPEGPGNYRTARY